MTRLWPWFAALLSGILLALCFDPADWGGLAWIGLTPLIAAIWFSEAWPHYNAWRLFLLGYVTGLGYFIGCFHWLYTVTIPGWITLCLYLALYPAVWALFVGWFATPRQPAFEPASIWLKSWSNLRVSALAAIAWVGLEWVRGVLFSGFGWNNLGVALHDNIALIQICDITGVGGLSFLLVMSNMMIVATIKRITMEVGRHRLRPHYDFSLTAALVTIAFSYGVRQIFLAPPPSEPLTIAAVQGNVPILVKRDPAKEEAILQQHINLTEKAIAMQPDLLLWPEAATPGPLFSDQRSWDVVRQLAEKHDGDFLLGTVHYDDTGDYNSVALLTDHAKSAQLYHKMHLVPYGEYVPLRHSFPLFAWIVGDLVPEDFDFGKEAVVLEMARKPVKIGALICFEDTLGDLARQFAANGAQLFVNVTNDGWFLKSAGSAQHLANAVFRSAETKLPMVRAANTGVTCVVDRFGRVPPNNRLLDEKGSPFMEGIFRSELQVPTNPKKTFYTLYGELFSHLCLAGTILAGGIGLLRRKS